MLKLHLSKWCALETQFMLAVIEELDSILLKLEVIGAKQSDETGLG